MKPDREMIVVVPCKLDAEGKFITGEVPPHGFHHIRKCNPENPRDYFLWATVFGTVALEDVKKIAQILAEPDGNPVILDPLHLTTRKTH